MKTIYILIYCIIISNSVHSQIKNGYKALKKENHELAAYFFKIELTGNKETYKVIALTELAKIYFRKKNNISYLDSAYTYINNGINTLNKLDLKKRLNLQKKGFSTLSLKNTRNKIHSSAYSLVKEDSTSQVCIHFLNHYQHIPPSQRELILKKRNQLLFKENKETYSQLRIIYLNYFQSYLSLQHDLAITLDKQLFKNFINEKGWKFFYTFKKKYPSNHYVQDSIASIELLKVIRSKDINLLKSYTLRFPKTPLVEFAIIKIAELTLYEDKLELYDFFVRNYPNYKEITFIWTKLYLKYFNKYGNDQLFYKLYPFAPQKLNTLH